MLLLRTDSLPSGEQWLYELKLDGYRAIAFKRNGAVHLRSRNDNDFNGRYPAVVEALKKLPDDTVIDGEVVAFDQEGRPSFNALQNYGSAPAPVVYYVFDVMALASPATWMAIAHLHWQHSTVTAPHHRARPGGRFERCATISYSRNGSRTAVAQPAGADREQPQRRGRDRRRTSD